ncbi:MAG: dTMP kinase [Acidobacteriota bacterium]
MRKKHKELKRGFLIVLEGIDGCGKTTQAKNLVKRLQEKGFDAVFYKEPSEGHWGKLIKEKAGHQGGLTPEQEFELFQNDREENVKINIKPALKKKKIVVLDRYYFSTMAYQSAKGIDIHEIKKRNDKIVVPPDLVIILDIDARSGLNRIKGRKKKDLLFEREDYLREVGKIFKSFSGENIIHLDAKESKERLYSKIEHLVMDTIKESIVFSP